MTANATLERCVLRGNVAPSTPGGGVAGAVRMRHCVLAENRGMLGGGLVATGPSIVEDCQFRRELRGRDRRRGLGLGG